MPEAITSARSIRKNLSDTEEINMELLKSKKGGLNPGILNSAILGLVLLVVLFQLYAQLIPTAQTAGNTLCSSGAPLGGLFQGTGIVFVIIMAALIILVVKAFLPGGGRGK